MKLLSCATVLLGFVLCLSTNKANAEATFICNTCNTSADYEMAAISVSPDVPNSRYYYQIGNTITKTFYFVEVVIPQREGDVPASVPIRDVDQLQSAETVFESRSTDEIVQAMHEGSINAEAVEASAADKEEFAHMVRISENQVMFSAGSNLGLDSFVGSDTIVISNAIWAAMTAANPGWQNKYVGFWGALWRALQTHFGKGPSGCIVFTNGDNACYQVNPMHKDAAMYLKDSAKRMDGTPIPTTEGIGGGGSDSGMDVMQYNHGGNSGYAYRTSGSTGWMWLFCSSQGGVIISCEIVVIM